MNKYTTAFFEATGNLEHCTGIRGRLVAMNNVRRLPTVGVAEAPHREHRRINLYRHDRVPSAHAIKTRVRNFEETMIRRCNRNL